MNSNNNLQNSQFDISRLFEQAIQHHQVGQLEQAKRKYQEILDTNPQHADSSHLLGLVEYQYGNYVKAIEHIQQAVLISPEQPVFLNNLGNVLKEMGELDRSVQAYQQALEVAPDDAEIHNNLGVTLKEMGELDRSVQAYQQALEINPQYAEAHNNLGNVLKEMDRLDESIHAYQQALKINPQYAEVYNNMGNVLKEMDRLDESLHAYQQALKINPQFVEGYYNIGVFFQEQRKVKESAQAYQKAIQIQPDYVEAHINLGVVLREQVRLKESIQAHQKAIQIQPDYEEAHINLAITFLLQGQLTAGWREFEWRRSRKRDFKRPLWDGTPLNGKSILIYAEQGFGDTIQFVRYIDLLPDANTIIIVVCQPELKTLFKSINRIDTLVTKGEDIPDSDVHVPLLSLPYMFNTTLDTIPARIPYLYLNSEADSVLHLDDSHDLKIGIVWAGRPTHANDNNRSIDLKWFKCLLDIRNCEFFSLQVGERREDIKQHGCHHTIKDLGEQFTDFHHTASAILQLDLVISVDTAVAHLAGALGKAIWTLLPFVPDWRWMLDRSDSPWYPSMTLFRQKEIGDWSPVFEQLRLALTRYSQS